MLSAVKALVSHLEAREGELGMRTRRRSREAQDAFLCAVETIACNLALATMDPLGRPVTIPRDAAVLRGRSRYSHACFGRGLTAALAVMTRPEVALVREVALGFSYANGDSAPSTVQPTTAFLVRFVPAALIWPDFRREAEPEVLVLKAPKVKGAKTGERVEYVDTAHTRRLRREVDRLNQVLSAAPFWLADDAEPFRLDKDGDLVDPLRRTVWRGFNNGSWVQGGRLWGGYWETMRRQDRFRQLRIGSAKHPEGERVANVDFRSLNPVLCYVLAGLPVPAGDLYDVLGYRAHRAGFKVLMGAMLFATERFRHMPGDARGTFPPGTRTREMVEAVERHHAPIADMFWQGLGHRLAYVESSILLDALADLRRQSITALPLHDSVLVAASEAGRAKLALETAFEPYGNGHRAAVSIDYGEQYQ
jgi:hypothetical protein